MHDELWSGAQLKIENARQQLSGMQRAIQPPEPTATNVALEASGAIVGGLWQPAFYSHVDAFLSAARSVPEIIQCCFGVDQAGVMRAWFNGLPVEEQQRRQEFKKQFEADYKAFRSLPLGNARNISEHRTGRPPVTVAITGLFGARYTGGPGKNVPMTETREIDDPGLAWMAKPVALRPMWDDFYIDGELLFPAFERYLSEAQSLVQKTQAISGRVHGTNPLTMPPA
jgi:hypothetical protein